MELLGQISSIFQLRRPGSPSTEPLPVGSQPRLRLRGLAKALASICACVGCVCICLPASAIDRDRRLDQLFHTSWTSRDGGPGEVLALAQTTDGYLWLGTDAGLVRFDGVRFESFQPFSGPRLPLSRVASLLAVPDGGLWIGYGTGVAIFLKEGKVKSFDVKSGLSGDAIDAFLNDRDGEVWAATNAGGLLRLDGSHWNRIGVESNFSEHPSCLFQDHAGTIWVGNSETVSYLLPGESNFRLAAAHLQGIGSLAESPGGNMWMAEMGRSVRPVPVNRFGGGSPAPEIIAGSKKIIFDNQGSLWVTSIGDGIRRVVDPDHLGGKKIRHLDDLEESFTEKQGLSGDYVSCILEDHEGNIWIGTRGGLDRFRETAVVSIPLPPGAALFSLRVKNSGIIEIGSVNRALMEIKDKELIKVPVTVRLDEGFLLPNGYADLRSYVDNPDTRLKELAKRVTFGGTADRPKRYSREEIYAFPEAYSTEKRTFGEAIENAFSKIFAIARDATGRPWFSIYGDGVYRADAHGTTSLEALGGPRGTAAFIFLDPTGNVWFGFKNKVAELTGDRVKTFRTEDGTGIGAISHISGVDSHVWIGGDKGLARFDGTRFWQMQSDVEGSFAGVRGTIVDPGNGLWIGANAGIMHIPEAELAAFESDHNYHVKFKVYGLQDGLTEPLQQPVVDASVARGTDGLFWFATSRGVAWLDPKRIPVNFSPPPVSIESIATGGKFYDPSGVEPLPARTTNLEIRYAGLSLSAPERVRFRYKLDGVDKDWQDVDTRRSAFYTNLGPGSYKFHVIACNNDGVWNEMGATGRFVIVPAYYQTWWFRLFYIALAFGALWLLYLYRLQQAKAQIQERLGAQMEERERIARELHDTLLQGFQGLMLRLQGVIKTLPQQEPAYQMMEKVLDRADEVLQEGRQRVRELRAEGMSGNDLIEALIESGEELAQGQDALFSLAVVGTPQTLNPIVCNEAYRIAQEAISNAFRHSNGSEIDVEVTYSSERLSLRVCDNGRGMSEDILASGRAGHWGLSGMRERAQKIGATLSLWSRPGGGTEIDLSVPSKIAYPQGRRMTPLKHLRRLAKSKEQD